MEFYLRHTYHVKLKRSSSLTAASTSLALQEKMKELLDEMGFECVEADREKNWELQAQHDWQSKYGA